MNQFKTKDLPIIDLNKNNQGKVMVEACLEHGFFYIDNRQEQVIDLKIVDELQQKSLKFFGLPINKKSEYAIEKSISLTGYAGFESITNFVPHDNEIYVIHSSSLFPIDKKNIQYSFEPALTEYIEACWKLNEKIYTHLAPYLDLNAVRNPSGFLKSWKDGFQERLWTGRFIHYPPNGGTIAPHNDVGLLTILNQDQTGGLQVWFQEEWVDVVPIPNTFVVNVGEILQNWSSGLLKSTRHRVINKKSVDRYSMTFLPLFDKFCEIYIKEKNEWKYPYNHLIERYYSIYKHLANSVQNPVDCLQGKTPKQIDDFHQQIFFSNTSQ